MQYETALISGRLIKRYKRFLADVLLDSGEPVTAHCPNTGAMTGCAEADSRVWLTKSTNPKRKLPYTWEWVECAVREMNSPDRQSLACVNTAIANKLVAEVILQGEIPALSGYEVCRQEVRYGAERSRIDLLLQSHAEGRPDCYVEVKSVTLCDDLGAGYFPDAKSERGQKHLRELAAMAEAGCRAVLFFCVNHTGIGSVQAATHIDPVYAELLRVARAQGVEVIAYGVDMCSDSATIRLVRPLPFIAE